MQIQESKLDSAIISPHFSQPTALWQQIAVTILFLSSFLGMIIWFENIDIYHAHFFDRGFSIFLYNFFRILFGLYLIWMIYAVGHMAILLVDRENRFAFSLLHRFIFGFGAGVGIWHIVMLFLGIFNMYYRSLMITLCLVVLLLSANHFKLTMNDLYHQIKMLRKNSGYTDKTLFTINSLLIGGTLIALLLVRGLYPGGGGDYFTHYFYYYLEVIRNHGLAPNDVWYHYYYSKGAGLYFLGILLTDPEAPQIVTFCCVMVASFALASLSNRLAPRSLWPAFCVVLYLAYNLIALKDGGGEFQKSHEETTALVVIATWALSLYRINPQVGERTSFTMIALTLIGAAILTQAITIFFVILLAIMASGALVNRNLRQLKYYTLLAGIGTTAVFGIFLLNYWVTGLATDQAINLTWRFANLERLNQWGVIPNVILVAWIRNNYKHFIVPWGWGTLQQLVEFIRLDVFRIIIASTIFFGYLLSLIKPRFFLTSNLHSTEQRELQNALVTISLIIGTFIVLSLFAGRSQSVSYFRFSSFFVPLLLLFTTICWGVFISRLNIKYLNVLRIIMPILLITFVLTSWHHWFPQVRQVTRNGLRFMLGKYSLADAYSHQHVGHPFGGIHPATFYATRLLPPNTRVWSTNVDSYCMIPNCRVESVISFKLSSHINEIIMSSPEVAKKILQKEKLNYFLFSKDYPLLDILPYSRLFNPSEISKYLGIKWTDGSTYLLTWRESSKAPIGSDFLNVYQKRLNEPENSWFLFSQAIQQTDTIMRTFSSSSHPWVPAPFPWHVKALHNKKR